jgi:hypothetical protein
MRDRTSGDIRKRASAKKKKEMEPTTVFAQ